MKFAESFKMVFGRDPTDREIQSYMRFTTATGIKENDALLSFFLFEERNLARLEDIPNSIKDASQDATRDAKERAKAAIDGAVSDAVPQLVDAVNKQIDRTAVNRSVTQKFQWLAIAAGAAAVLVATAGGLGWYLGSQQKEFARQTGFIEGSKANAFLSTGEGQIAFSWYKSGTLGNLIRCDRPGWSMSKDGICVVAPTKEGTYGWK